MRAVWPRAFFALMSLRDTETAFTQLAVSGQGIVPFSCKHLSCQAARPRRVAFGRAPELRKGLCWRRKSVLIVSEEL